jgi:hypothetical protein
MIRGRPAFGVVLDLALDPLREARAHVHRRDQEADEGRGPRPPGEEVEERDDVVRDRRVGGEQADVFVELRGSGVVVAGGDVRVAGHPGFLLAHDQRRLAVRLEAGNTEDDVRADLLEFPGPVQVACLVEPGVELDHARDLLPRLGGPDQRLHERCVVADAIDRHLDRDRQRVVGRLADEPFHARVEAVVRLVQDHVGLPDGGEDVGDRGLDELAAQDIADLVVQLHGEGVAIGYLRKVLQAVAMTLDHAGVEPNPARDKRVVRMPRGEQEQITPPSAAQILSIYRLLPSKHRLPLLFLDWSGARVSAIDLTLVGDYDEPRRRVRLRASTTKTRRALWIELHPVLADALEARLGPREDRDPAARLFVGSGADRLRTAMAKACKAAGTPLFSPHDLRHRRISLIHLRGVPWARIGEFVGQRNLATTANVTRT